MKGMVFGTRVLKYWTLWVTQFATGVLARSYRKTEENQEVSLLTQGLECGCLYELRFLFVGVLIKNPFFFGVQIAAHDSWKLQRSSCLGGILLSPSRKQDIPKKEDRHLL